MPTPTPMVVARVLAASVEGCTKTRPPERFSVDMDGEGCKGGAISLGWFGSAGANDGPPMGACSEALVSAHCAHRNESFALICMKEGLLFAGGLPLFSRSSFHQKSL